MVPTREGHKIAQILEILGEKNASKMLLKGLLSDLPTKMFKKNAIVTKKSTHDKKQSFDY
jgi:hypothetical protein